MVVVVVPDVVDVDVEQVEVEVEQVAVDVEQVPVAVEQVPVAVEQVVDVEQVVAVPPALVLLEQPVATEPMSPVERTSDPRISASSFCIFVDPVRCANTGGLDCLRLSPFLGGDHLRISPVYSKASASVSRVFVARSPILLPALRTTMFDRPAKQILSGWA